jgi:putative ABC transport system substrate-binding protein
MAGLGVAASPSQAAERQTRVGILTIEELASPILPLDQLADRLTKASGYTPSVTSAHGQPARLPALAVEMVGAKPDIIVAVGTPAVAALHATGTSIPVVMIAVGNPVGQGFVKSRAHPGGTLTGVSDLRADTAHHRLGLIKVTIPAARRIGYMRVPGAPQLGPLETAAAEFGQTLIFLDVRDQEDIDVASARLSREHMEALIVIPSPATFAARHRISDAARENRLPVLFGWRQFADAAGLMCYGADLVQLFIDAADIVRRIAGGENAGNIPIVDPDMTLVLNRRVAARLGVTFPASLVDRASVIVD